MMNLRIVTGVIALFVFAGAAGVATAQETTKTTHKKTRTLTGCLQKGEDANEYNFTAKGGSTWEIKSDSVKLDVVRLKFSLTYGATVRRYCCAIAEMVSEVRVEYRVPERGRAASHALAFMPRPASSCASDGGGGSSGCGVTAVATCPRPSHARRRPITRAAFEP